MSSHSIPATVVVPTYNRGKKLVDSIECILANAYPNYELLVVDQTEEHSAEVATALRDYARHEHVHHIRLPIPNLPLARNVGLRRAQGDIIIYVDDDVELHRNFIAAHARRYDDASVHAVAGRVRRPDVDASNNEPPPPGRIKNDGHIEGHFWQAAHDSHPVDWGLGCNMSFRTRILLNIGAFDERYAGSATNEEVDVFVRLNDAGYNTIFAPEASLLHHVSPDGGCRDREAVRDTRSTIRNRCLYATKTLRGRHWLQYVMQEFRSSYSFVRLHNLGPLAFAKLIASGLRGIAAYYTQSPTRHSDTLKQAT